MKAAEDADLMEFGKGLPTGLSRYKAAAKYPKAERLPLRAAAYGQESALKFRFRAERALRIFSENSEEPAAAFTHGGKINRRYSAFPRMPVDSDMARATGDVGVHEWHAQPGLRSVHMVNTLARIGGLE